MNPKRFSIDSVDRFRSNRTHAPAPGQRVLGSDPEAPKTKKNLKRFSIDMAIRRKSNHVHALASRLMAMRPDLVTLLKLTLLSIVALAATDDSRQIVLGPCAVKISCDTKEWAKFVADNTDGWTAFRKGWLKGTTHQKTFHQLRYDDDWFFDNENLIPFIEMPLRSIERADNPDAKKPEEKNVIVIVDNQKVSYTLKFKVKAERDSWSEALKNIESRRMKDSLFYRAFWQKVLGKSRDNDEYSPERIASMTEKHFKDIQVKTRYHRMIFARQLQAVMRPSGACNEHAWNLVGQHFNDNSTCKHGLRMIVYSRLDGLFDYTRQDHYAECLIPLLADIENLDNQFFRALQNDGTLCGKTSKKHLQKSAIWQEHEIWRKIFLLLLEKNLRIDVNEMRIEDWLRNILTSANVMFLPRALELIVGDDIDKEKKLTLFHEVEKNAMDHIRELMLSKVPKASLREFNNTTFQTTKIEPVFTSSAKEFVEFVYNPHMEQVRDKRKEDAIEKGYARQRCTTTAKPLEDVPTDLR